MHDLAKCFVATLAIAVSVVCAAAAAAEPPKAASAPSGFEAEPNDRVLIVDAKTSLPDLGFATFNEKRISGSIKAALKDRPEDAKLHLIIGDFYSNHPAYEGINFFVREVVPLDANGRYDGDEKWFSQDGRLLRTVPWKAGVKDGNEVVRAGVSLVEIPWQNGKIEGIRRMYFPDGKVQTETTCANGAANGPARTFDPNGCVVRECMMKNDKRNGPQTEYWPGGTKPKRVTEFKDNLVVGTAKEYYLSGKIKREAAYVNDILHGEEKQYDENGTVALDRFWFDGKLVTKEEYAQKTGKK